MQIGILIPNISLGGAGLVAVNQVKYLIRNGYKAKLLTLSGKSLGVPSFKIGLNFPLPLMKTSFPLLVNIIWGLNVNEPDVDVIIAHGIASILALRLKKKYGINYINYIHHPNSFLHGKPIHEREEVNILGPLAILPFKLLWNKKDLAQRDLKSVREAKYNFVNSWRTLRLLINIYGKIKASVCYPAIEDSFHDVMPKLENKENFILYASRHVKQKGFHLLPKIFSRIKSKVKLIIVGKTTSITKSVMDEFERLGLSSKVIFKPNVTRRELLEFYKKSRVLLYPAFKEDFGLSPIEGMATGCIPVAWKDGGGVEETIQDFKTGLLAKSYDVNDFASKVDLLLSEDNVYSSILNEAKIFSQKFSWDLHIKKLLNVLKNG